MRDDGAADGFDLSRGAIDGGLASDGARNPDGEEDRVEAAFAHARDVDVAVRVSCAEIEIRIEQALRGVVVRVDDDGFGVKFLRLWCDGAGLLRGCQGKSNSYNDC